MAGGVIDGTVIDAIKYGGYSKELVRQSSDADEMSIIFEVY